MSTDGSTAPVPHGHPHVCPDAEEEAYYRHVHYMASALFMFGAAEDVLGVLSELYKRAANGGLDGGEKSANPAVATL